MRKTILVKRYMSQIFFFVCFEHNQIHTHDVNISEKIISIFAHAKKKTRKVTRWWLSPLFWKKCKKKLLNFIVVKNEWSVIHEKNCYKIWQTDSSNLQKSFLFFEPPRSIRHHFPFWPICSVKNESGDNWQTNTK